MTLVGHEPGEASTVVPLTGLPPSRVLVARREADHQDPMIRSFVRTAVAAYDVRRGPSARWSRNGPARRRTVSGAARPPASGLRPTALR
ncbi:hypothetical protein [Streptomyces sp. WAC 04229]|uniref:hypothetical protein n=1 Tax=Streptomyces sp. WAC 04229 TaxID=2203206 RepID=UPI00269C4522